MEGCRCRLVEPHPAPIVVTLLPAPARCRALAAGPASLLLVHPQGFMFCGHHIWGSKS